MISRDENLRQPELIRQESTEEGQGILSFAPHTHQ